MTDCGSVLLIGDRPEVAGAWAQALQAKGLACYALPPVDDALRRWREGLADLAVVDLYASAAAGREMCRNLRALAISPILLLCDAPDEATVLAGYASGADEVISRPVSPLILVCKVEAWLRHCPDAPASALVAIEQDGLRLQPWSRTVQLADGRSVRLTPLELRLLYLLMGRPRRVYATETILERVWGQEGGDTAQLKNLIYRLRKKIEPDPRRPRYLHTAPGRGYSFGAR